VIELLIGLIADTHLKDKPVPGHVIEALSGADMILHAGDILDMQVIEQLSGVAETVAVRGNMDYEEAVRLLPETRVIEVGGFRIGLTHGYGPPGDMTHKVREMFDDVDCIVFGHTHQPLVQSSGGVLFVNPGSPTDKAFTDVNSVGLLEVSDKMTPRIVYLDGAPVESGD
jgi:uncharacterized protein